MTGHPTPSPVASADMSGKETPAIVALRQLKIPAQVHDLGADGIPDDDRGYGLAAAAAMDVPAERIFKTILVTDPARRGSLAVAMVPVTTTVNLKAVAKAIGAKKVEVAAAADAERATGYVVGGISPIGQRKRLPAVLDDTAMDHATVHVSGGRRGLELELAPADLVSATGAIVAPIGR